MRVYVNGDPVELPESTTVSALLEQLALPGPVAVEVDQEIVPRAERGTRLLAPEARVEIVHFVGGG